MKLERFNWSQLQTGGFSIKLNSMMLTSLGHIRRVAARLKGEPRNNFEPPTREFHYDESYVIGYLEDRVLRPLFGQKPDLEKMNELLQKAAQNILENQESNS